VTGSSFVVGVFASRTGARNVVAVPLRGSRIGKSSVLSSGEPYNGPKPLTVGVRRSVPDRSCR
jgi:hypothetical protein